MGIWKSFIGNSKSRLTPEGGIAVRMINKTGGASVKGHIVQPEGSTNDAVELTIGGDIDPIGIIYDADIPDGNLVWVIVAGIADVLYSNTVTRATFSRVSTAGEGLPNGVAVNEALPTPPFATDKHFQEIGHPIESRTGAGLARTILHFN